ncbi:hypothetical protein AK830_g4384 [Neonectria ditissima]|uniref:FAD-binding PCMH-type domain-containing protein n=1 Tax=Neonectria ditissima TaxID=78410 RepID=A0A0P7BG55_9HYPO|nr:hypothetical protein AK830_g4384 [Neonectria ditissima]
MSTSGPSIRRLGLAAIAAFNLLGIVPLVEGSPQDLERCLFTAVNRQASQVQFPYEANFQEIDARPYNLNFRYEPFAITYPKDKNQVPAVVRCAATHNRKVQARSGGHDYTNKALGGANGTIVVDVKYLNSVQVDSITGLAKIGSGNKLKDVAEKLHLAGGRYMPHGSSPTVGIGGHATVGGLGLHTRLEGTSLDVLKEAEVVLADGSIVLASSTKNSDLFWAIRGAGASFGIVTTFTFQTKPEPKQILNFACVVASTSAASLADSFKAYHQIVTDRKLDPRFSAAVVIQKNQFIISGAYFGSESDFNSIKLASRAPGITEQTVTPGLTWSQHINRIFDSISSMFPAQSYLTAQDTAITYSTLPSNKSIDTLFQHLQTGNAGSERWFVLVDFYGGAVGNLATDATAFPHRDVSYFFAPYVITESTTGLKTHEFVEKAVLAIQGNQPDKYLSYAGYTSPQLGPQSQKKYWGPNLPRLEKVKKSIDPDDVFSTPQGAKPNLVSAAPARATQREESAVCLRRSSFYCSITGGSSQVGSVDFEGYN